VPENTLSCGKRRKLYTTNRLVFGIENLLAKKALAEENGHGSNRAGAYARSAIRYAQIFALLLGASLALTTAAVAVPTPTALFSTATIATTSSLSVLSHDGAGIGFTEAQGGLRRSKTGKSSG
jgi:hypothetical protein